MTQTPPSSTVLPYTTLFRSILFEHQMDPDAGRMAAFPPRDREAFMAHWAKILANETVIARTVLAGGRVAGHIGDRKSTRLNSSHVENSYAVFCLKKKTQHIL